MPLYLSYRWAMNLCPPVWEPPCLAAGFSICPDSSPTVSLRRAPAVRACVRACDEVTWQELGSLCFQRGTSCQWTGRWGCSGASRPACCPAPSQPSSAAKENRWAEPGAWRSATIGGRHKMTSLLFFFFFGYQTELPSKTADRSSLRKVVKEVRTTQWRSTVSPRSKLVKCQVKRFGRICLFPPNDSSCLLVLGVSKLILFFYCCYVAACQPGR